MSKDSNTELLVTNPEHTNSDSNSFTNTSNNTNTDNNNGHKMINYADSPTKNIYELVFLRKRLGIVFKIQDGKVVVLNTDQSKPQLIENYTEPREQQYSNSNRNSYSDNNSISNAINRNLNKVIDDNTTVDTVQKALSKSVDDTDGIDKNVELDRISNTEDVDKFSYDQSIESEDCK